MANIFHAPFTISQNYGCTGFPAEPAYGDCPHFHRGIDLVGPNPGCPIYAASPGTARFVGNDPSGNYVIIECDDGHWEAYWHDQTMTVKPGQHVDNSVEIATEGNTGNSTGYHVHFECEAPGRWSHLLAMTPIDPTPYLQDTQGGATTVTDEQDFQNCFITVATRFATQDEIKTWQGSGQGPYEWVQKNAPNAALNQARIDAFKACFITVSGRWPTSDETNGWISSGLSAYEWVQKNALNPILDAKDQEIRNLQSALDKTTQPTGQDALDLQVGRSIRAAITTKS